MAKRMLIQLGNITLVKLNEADQDEIYVVGGVEVRNRNGEVRRGLTKYFGSANTMLFKDADVGVARALGNQGDAYDEILDDDDVAFLVLLVIEHDAASTVKDINGELLGFIRELGQDVEAMPGSGEFTRYIPVVELVMKFMNMVSNILDDDDLLLKFERKYRRSPSVDSISIATNMDEGLYDPVTLKVTLEAA
jgi:hypothetical protein